MRSIAASAKSILPKSVEVWLRSFKLKALSKKEVKTVFSDIYEKSLWGESKEKFCSGMGSSEVNSNEYVAWVNQFITDKKIQSVVDLGCGDFQVGRRLELPGRSGRPFKAKGAARRIVMTARMRRSPLQMLKKSQL